MKLKCEIVKVETKKNKDGNKFNVYKSVDKNGKLLDVRFTRDSRFSTDKCGTVYGDGNIDRNRRFPCVWFKSVDSFVPWAETESDDTVHDVSDLF